MSLVKTLNLFLIISFSFLSLRCSFVEQKLSQEQDATIAYKLPAPQVDSFKFSDIMALRNILDDQIKKYDVGLGYLQKAADLYKGQEGITQDKRVVEATMELNNLRAL